MTFERKTVGQDSFSDFILALECVPGIALAGAAYPIVAAALLFMGYVVPQMWMNQSWWGDLPLIISTSILWLIAGTALGLAVAFFSAWLAGIFFWLVNSSLGRVFNPLLFLSLMGGLAGYAPLSLLFFHPDALLKNSEAIPFFLVGPCLGTLFGQTGARMWARKKIVLPPYARDGLNMMQFKLAHFFSLTAWIALGLTCCRFASGTSLPFLIAAYFPTQLICLCFGQAIDNYLEKKSGIRYVN